MRIFSFLFALLLVSISTALTDGLKVTAPRKLEYQGRILSHHHHSESSQEQSMKSPSRSKDYDDDDDDDDDHDDDQPHEPTSAPHHSGGKGKGKGKGGGKGKGEGKGKGSKSSKKTTKTTKTTKKSTKTSKKESSSDKGGRPSGPPASTPTDSSAEGTRPPIDVTPPPTRPPVDLGDLQPVELSRYAISYTIESDEMPTRGDYMRVVRDTGIYFEDYMIERYQESTQADLVAFETFNASMSFVFGEPVLIEYESIAYFSADTNPLPRTAVLDTVLMQALDDPDDYIEVLNDLPSSNPFSTTTDVSFEEPTVKIASTKSSESADSTNYGSVATSAVGLSLIVAGAFLVRRNKDGRGGVNLCKNGGGDADTYAGDTFKGDSYFVDVDLEHHDSDHEMASIEHAWEDEPISKTKTKTNKAGRKRKSSPPESSFQLHVRKPWGQDIIPPNNVISGEEEESNRHDRAEGLGATDYPENNLKSQNDRDDFDEFLAERSASKSPSSSFEADELPSRQTKSWDDEFVKSNDIQRRTYSADGEGPAQGTRRKMEI